MATRAEPRKRRTVGILGGMGPAATMDLCSKIIRLTPAARDEEHLNLQIDCNPVPGVERRSLCERAIRLQVLGADLIAVPCNSAHLHLEYIQAAVSIPVVNMIRAAVLAVLKQAAPGTEVGILAWHEVISGRLYQLELERAGLIPLVPNPEQTRAVSDFIDEIKGSRVTEAGRRSAIEAGNALIRRGAQAIILACTDLPLEISHKDFEQPVIDATQALAQAVVERATGVAA